MYMLHGYIFLKLKKEENMWVRYLCFVGLDIWVRWSTPESYSNGRNTELQ